MGTHVSERESYIPNRRHALCLGVAAIVVPAAVAGLTVPTDPIFAVIAEHRRRMEPVHAWNTEVHGEDQLAELLDDADEQFTKLLHTMPTTLAGLLAMVSYVGKPYPELPLGVQETEDGTTFEQLFLDTLRRSMERIIAGGRA